MQIKKRSFTLIETIIALFLLSIILTFTFGFFAKLTRVEKQIEVTKNKIYANNNLHIRLNNIFANIITENFYNNSPFYSSFERNDKNQTLNLIFDNGVDPNPYFSERVQAKIFINKDNIYLEITPRNDKINMNRKEILFTNVNTIKYKFLAAKDLEMQKYQIEKVNEDIYWYSAWPKNKKTLPLAMLIEINNNLKFAFFLTTQSVKI